MRAHGLGLVEQLARVRKRRARAFADLLEVRLRVVALSDRRDVERDGAGGEAERIEPRVHQVHLLLDVGDERGKRGEFGHGRAVDALQAVILEVDVHPALARDDPLAPFGRPEERGRLLVRQLRRRGRRRHVRVVGDRAEVERKPVGKRRDEFALGVEVGIRARGGLPDPELPDLARIAVAAEGDVAAREVHREAGVERGGCGDDADGVDEHRLGRTRRRPAKRDKRVHPGRRDADLDRRLRRAGADDVSDLLVAVQKHAGDGNELVGLVVDIHERLHAVPAVELRGIGLEVLDRGRRVSVGELRGRAEPDEDAGVLVGADAHGYFRERLLRQVGPIHGVGVEVIGALHGIGDGRKGVERRRDHARGRIALEGKPLREGIKGGERCAAGDDRRGVRLRRHHLELDRPGAVQRERHRIGLVEFGPDGIVAAREAVTPVGAALRLGGKQRVADGPVAERAEAAARSPLAIAEVPGLVVVEIARARRAAVVAVRLARRAVHGLRRHLRHVVRGLRELRLVVVVHVHHSVRHDHLAHRRRPPREIRVAEEPVVARERAEVVPVGVAVALRILVGCVVLVDDALVVSGDVVVDGVGNLAGRDALREVPDETVVVRRDVRGGRVVAAPAAQEREFLVEERRHLVVEREERGRERAVVKLEAGHLRVVEVRPEADRRVERVDVRLVAERVVEVGEAGDGELELLVRVRVVDAHLERHRLGLGEQRLVELDEARVLERVVVERHVALVGLARLDDHRDGRLGFVRGEVPHPLRERRHVVEDALHPPFRERGRIGPLRPRAAHRRVGGRIRVLGPVADGVVRVDHVLESVALVPDRKVREAGRRLELRRVLAVEVLRH